MFTSNEMTFDMDEIAAFLIAERGKVLSDAEWRFRMRGYGYNLRKTANGVEVAKLPQNQVIGTITL